jgi:hypothetical protein
MRSRGSGVGLACAQSPIWKVGIVVTPGPGQAAGRVQRGMVPKHPDQPWCMDTMSDLMTALLRQPVIECPASP